MFTREQPYSAYIERLEEIRRLSTPAISDLKNAGEYEKRLKENFKKIGQLAAQNRSFLRSELFPAMDQKHNLTGDEMSDLLSFGEHLISATSVENIDLSLMSLVSQKLMESGKEADETSSYIRLLDARMDNCYAMMTLVGRITAYPHIADRYRREGLTIGKHILAFLEHERFEALDVECREIVLTDARYMAVFYEGQSARQHELGDELTLLEDMLRLYGDPYYHALAPDFDWRYFKYRVLNYYAKVTDLYNIRQFNREELQKICERTEEFAELWRSDPDFFGQYDNEKQIRMLVFRNRYLAGRLSFDEYRGELIRLYRQRNSRQYDLNGVYDNLQIPLEALSALNLDLIAEDERERIRRVYRDMLLYAFHMPNNGSFSTLLEYYIGIIHRYIEIPGGITFEEMALRCLAALHQPTYIHSVMVARLCECLAGYVVAYKPELMIGIEGCQSKDKVMANRSALCDFAFHAGLCHDLGKLAIIDTIFVYGRDLFDTEFELIKTHPLSGYDLLKKYDSTRKYADVALGHHRWYDNSRGYPADYNTEESSLKTMIDIALLADCLDAATDSVGRSYKNAKTLDDFIREITPEAGTHYAPWLTELLSKEDVRRDIEHILTEGRRQTYQQTYDLLQKMCESSADAAE